MFMKRVLLLTGLYALCAVINPLSIVAEEELVAECDPDQTYPNNPPGPEGGCGDYDDCNGNGAFDIGEPCREHHGEHDAHVECDPDLEYPNNPPGAEEGCGSFEDCNGNGAFDLGEPCFEHHGEDGDDPEDP